MNTNMEYAYFQDRFEVGQFHPIQMGKGTWYDPEKETYSRAIDRLKKEISDEFIRANPQVTWNDAQDFHGNQISGLRTPFIGESKLNGWNAPPPSADTEVAIKPLKQRPKDRTEAIIFDIGTCTEMTVLKSYEILARNNPKIKEAYDKKKNELA